MTAELETLVVERRWAELRAAAVAALQEAGPAAGQAHLWYLEGVGAMGQGAFAEALAAADESAGRNPAHPEGMRLRAEALLALGRWDAAAMAVTTAVDLADGADDEPADDERNLTLATAIAVGEAVGRPDDVARWRGLAGPAIEPADLVVGAREAASASELDLLAAQERAERLSRPGRVARDLMGNPLNIDGPGGMIVLKERAVPDAKASSFGLAVLAVLFVVLLAWLCRPVPKAGDGSGGGRPGTTCVARGLGLTGDTIDLPC